MGWKNFSSWLKGGIIGFLISLLFMFFPTTKFFRDLIENIEKRLFPCTQLSSFECIGSDIKMVLIFLLVFILVGAIIGWIIGKIKSKKQETEKTKK